MNTFSLFTACVLLFVGSPAVWAQEQINDPGRIDLPFNRFYDYNELTEALRKIAAAYPELCRLESIGKSYEGRDLWVVTLNNPATGLDRNKAAIYIDGNVHGNEIQASETCLYTLWYLLKSYGRVEALTKIMDERAFYVLPSVNPDGRQHWFETANTSSSSRSGKVPLDNDNDGLEDEDGYDDLDGDGDITTMWRKDPRGSFKLTIQEPRRMVRVEPGELGEYTFAGSEGLDNDGDGQINEDGPGGYDLNRNWPSDWQPNYVQFGAGDYPFSHPEPAAIGRFILEHPNIAAVQSYHNAGGMILRGPGAQYRENYYPRQDAAVYDEIGRLGERIIPNYRYLIIYKDLYTVHGGFINWTWEGLGIFSFTNELWTNPQYFYGKEGDWAGRVQSDKFDEHLMFGQYSRPFKSFEHPTLGEVVIGGSTKYGSRIPPPFMLEELCHRNFAFTVYHADQMPRLEWGRIDVKPLMRDGLWQITAEVRNTRAIPTISRLAVEKTIGGRDYAELTTQDRKEGESSAAPRVVATGTLNDWFDEVMRPSKHHALRIWSDAGVAGKGASIFRWIVEGEGDVELRYHSDKAAAIRHLLPLAEGRWDFSEEVRQAEEARKQP